LGAAVVCLVLPAAVAQADRNVNANEPVVISDDITDRTRGVVSAFARSANSGDPSANDDNRSGLGDETNPNQGQGRNAMNDGTDNPTEGSPGGR
jgi:hypothetical protein